MKPITDKPNPTLLEKLASLLIVIGIGTAVTPFGVKFLTGMRSMSDAMVIGSVIGVVLLITGAALAVASKKRGRSVG